MAKASLRIRAVSPEPSLFAHMEYGSRQRAGPKIRHLALLNARLKNEFTEDEKYHNLMRWLISDMCTFWQVTEAVRLLSFSLSQ